MQQVFVRFGPDYPEMPITLDAKCCAGVTPATHDAAIATMRMCQINVINAG